MKKVITKSFQCQYELCYIEFNQECERMTLASEKENGSYIQPIKITKEEAERLVDFSAEKDGELGCDHFWYVTEETVKTSLNTNEIAFILASYLISENKFEQVNELYKTISNPFSFKVELHKIINITNQNYNKSFKKIFKMIEHLISDVQNRFDIVIVAGYELLHNRRK